ncbi:hypothetical protein HanRHA438_Chr06g0281471 [Helianthus annuus]|nr:hypothetical protein HanRHA438_Chr06g0281471 [Helianthus annuus]
MPYNALCNGERGVFCPIMPHNAPLHMVLVGWAWAQGPQAQSPYLVARNPL